jgi:hypothetical protein
MGRAESVGSLCKPSGKCRRVVEFAEGRRQRRPGNDLPSQRILLHHTNLRLGRCHQQLAEEDEASSSTKGLEPLSELLQREGGRWILEKCSPSLIQHGLFFFGHLQGVQFRRDGQPEFVHQLELFPGREGPHFRKIGQRHTSLILFALPPKSKRTLCLFAEIIFLTLLTSFFRPICKAFHLRESASSAVQSVVFPFVITVAFCALLWQ